MTSAVPLLALLLLLDLLFLWTDVVKERIERVSSHSPAYYLPSQQELGVGGGPSPALGFGGGEERLRVVVS